MRHDPRPGVGSASLRTAIGAVLALLLVGLATAGPSQSRQPLIHAAVAVPLAAFDGWQLPAGSHGPLRESAMIAFAGSALLAAAAVMRRNDVR